MSGLNAEPGPQRRRRFGPGAVTQPCTALLGPSHPQAQPTAYRKEPSAGELNNLTAI